MESLSQIMDAAQAGDDVAAEAIREAGRYLAIAVSMLNVIIAPDVVYIGGAFSRVYDLLVEAMQPILHHRGPELHRQGLRIEPAVFLADTSLMGAAALVFEHRLGGSNKKG
jgi:predicted NBD/HSP70 family sugar kinase